MTPRDWWLAAARRALGHALAAEHGGRVECAAAWAAEAEACAAEAEACAVAAGRAADAAAQVMMEGAG